MRCRPWLCLCLSRVGACRGRRGTACKPVPLVFQLSDLLRKVSILYDACRFVRTSARN